VKSKVDFFATKFIYNALQHLFNKVLYINASKRDIQHIRLFAQSAHATIRSNFQKINFKITARALPAIPPKFTGVPITQPNKIILMKKYFFGSE
jgi:hypothetical protein